MLTGFEQRRWLTLQLATNRRQHAEWLDLWLRQCQADYAVFVDSDVEFRQDDWLRDLTALAQRSGAALVGAEMIPEFPFYVEPVGLKTVRLAARPAPWLLLLDVAQVAQIQVGFSFRAEETDRVPEGLVAYDVGGYFFRQLQTRALRWEIMPDQYRRKYRHYGGLSWVPSGGRRGFKKARDLRAVERHARKLRRDQERASAG